MSHSKYLDDHAEKCRSECNRKISDCEQKCRSKTYQLENSIKGAEAFFNGWAITLAIIVFAVMLSQFEVEWPISLAVAVGILFVMYIIRITSVESEITRVKDRCSADCQKYNQECQAEIEAYKKNYLNNVSKARKAWSASAEKGYLKYAVDDLTKEFDMYIRSAERGWSIAEIQAVFMYEVKEKELTIQRPQTYGSGYSDIKKYSYDKDWRLYDPQDIYSQVALAQVLSEILEHEAMKRYKVDPVHKTPGIVPTVSHTGYNDAHIELTYKVLNPSFVPRGGYK